MPQSIQNPPFGFLDLIGAKSMGQNPNLVRDDASPVFDLTSFTLVGRTQESAGTTAAPLTLKDEGISLVVPPREVWWIQNITGFMNTSIVNARASLGLLIRYTGNGNNLYVAVKDPVLGTSNTTRVVISFTPPQPMMIPAGGLVSIKLNDDVGVGSLTGGLQVAYVPLSQ